MSDYLNKCGYNLEVPVLSAKQQNDLKCEYDLDIHVLSVKLQTVYRDEFCELSENDPNI